MSRIRCRDTRPEILTRSALHRLGFRFRLQDRSLPGRPDIVLPKYKTVLFVHGCFWHRHKGCRYTTHPATREEFWASKFERNMQRDLQVRTELEALGWDVGVIWECQTRAAGDLEAAIARLLPPRKATRSAPPKVHEESAQAT